MEDPEFQEVFLCVKSGLSKKEALEFDPIERRAWAWLEARSHGCKIDYETGAIIPPDENSS